MIIKDVASEDPGFAPRPRIVPDKSTNYRTRGKHLANEIVFILEEGAKRFLRGDVRFAVNIMCCSYYFRHVIR